MHLVFASGFLVPQHLRGLDYFRETRLHFSGALFPNVDPVASIDVRAQALAAAIHGAFPTGPIHVIAHSMGGLDTRRLLRQNLQGLANAGRVVALSTISTPHYGSPIADLLVGPKPNALDLRSFHYFVLQALALDLRLDIGSLGDLTTGAAISFNQKNNPPSGVLCRSYAGGAQESTLLRAGHLYCKVVARTDDDRINDGLVPLSSARWEQFAESVWPTDHIGEVGHSLTPPRYISAFDHNSAYRRIVATAEAILGV